MPPPLLTLQSRRVSASPLLLSSAGRHPSPPLHTSPSDAPPLLRGSRVVGAVAGEEGRALRAIWWTKITTGGGGRGRSRRQSRRCRCWRRRPRTTWRAAPGARWTGGRRRTRASPTAASSTSGSSSSAPDDEGRDGRNRGRCVRAVGGVPQVQGQARRGRGGGVQGRADEAAAAHAERVLAGGQADGVRASQDVQGYQCTDYSQTRFHEILQYIASQSQAQRSRSQEMPRCYVVYVGRVPGVYEEWKHCQKQVNNFSDNSYQGYESREVTEEKWRRHGRKKWRNFLVITTLLLFMVGMCSTSSR